jgi:hypothetical protein
MTMKFARSIFSTTLIAIAGLGLLAGCSSDSSDSDESKGDGDTTDTLADDETSTPEAPTADLPAFSTEWATVCTTQVGYAGAKAYEPGPGPHTIVYMENYRDEGNYITSSRTLPAGWALVEDTDYEDNSEFAAVELVGCLDRTETTPTGIQCDFEDEGVTTTLELVDADYDLTIYAATSGESIGTTAITASEDECPFIATFQDGDTEFVASPSDDDIVNALKEFVAPS